MIGTMAVGHNVAGVRTGHGQRDEESINVRGIGGYSGL